MGLFDDVVKGVASGGLSLLGGGFFEGGEAVTNTSVTLAERGDIEAGGETLQQDILKQLQDLIGAEGAGDAGDKSRGSAEQLAALLQQSISGGGQFDQENLQRGQQFASDVFAPEQEALGQRFEQQNIQNARLASQLGRPINDPILRAKLAQEQTRQQATLGAQQRSFGAQAGQQFGQQRLGSAQSLFGLRSGLATQALQNKQTLFSLGRDIEQRGLQARQFAASGVKSEAAGSLSPFEQLSGIASLVGTGAKIASGGAG